MTGKRRLRAAGRPGTFRRPSRQAGPHARPVAERIVEHEQAAAGHAVASIVLVAMWNTPLESCRLTNRILSSRAGDS